jgi:DNA-binding XRE family transcriptional regulator
VDLAKRIGVSEMTIVNWEKGRVRPMKRNLGRIKAILAS